MSPVFEPTAIAGQRYQLRHVGPRSAVFPNALGANHTVLARPDFVARKLPIAGVPGSPDFVSGSWTSRLGDAGEFTLVFPNTISSDGVPWRSRFTTDAHLQWIEILDNGELDFAGVIVKVDVDDQKVVVSGFDAMWLLKKAYVRDWTVVMSPRDVIERASQLWVPTTVDNFPAGSLNTRWTPTGSVSIGAQGGLVLSVGPSSNTAQVQIATNIPAVSATGTWAASLGIASLNLAGTGPSVRLQVQESDGTAYVVQLDKAGPGGALEAVVYVQGPGGWSDQVQNVTATSYSLRLESDGEWIWGFVNGSLIGCARRKSATTTSLQTTITQFGTSSGGSTIAGVFLGALQPFAM